MCAWHEHHERTVNDLEKRRAARQRLIMAAPAMLEAYSVLTRLPPPHRLTAADTLHLLDKNWGHEQGVALAFEEYWKLLHEESARKITGGRVHDALMARCARKAKAEELLTWNIADFAAFEGKDLAICQPGESA